MHTSQKRSVTTKINQVISRSLAKAMTILTVIKLIMIANYATALAGLI